MANEQALPMGDVAKKLENLRELLPGTEDMTYEFAAYLGQRFQKKQQLVPNGFVMECTLALHDLQKGVNGWTSEPIRNRLVGLPSMFYDLMYMDIPRISQAVLPEDFAKEVIQFLEEVKKKTAEQ